MTNFKEFQSKVGEDIIDMYKITEQSNSILIRSDNNFISIPFKDLDDIQSTDNSVSIAITNKYHITFFRKTKYIHLSIF